MKIIRYQTSNGDIHFGAPDGNSSAQRLKGDLYDGLQPSGQRDEVSKLLAPLVPTALYCIGLNYKRHAEESNLPAPKQPVLFMKGPNAVQNPGDPIEIPTRLASHKVDYECELAVIIGKACKNISKEDALNYVLGYTCSNDVSARDWQIEWGGGQWCRGKTFDTFCPLGPCIVTPDDIPDPNRLSIRTLLNGDAAQDWNTDDMIFSVAEIIEFLSGSATLLPGTVILTGTPHGVGMAAQPPRWLKPGDEVTIEIEGIGALANPVALES